MRYQVLEPIRVRTPKGEMELQPGQLITLPPEKAVKLIDKGKILPDGDLHPKDLKVSSETVSLRQAYRAIWSLSEDDPIEAYEAAWREIEDRERKVPSEVALSVLKEEAQGFYDRTGLCPFCQGPVLHLPPASPLEWTD